MENEQEEFYLPVVIIKNYDCEPDLVREIKEFQGFKHHIVTNKRKEFMKPKMTTLEEEFLKKASIVIDRIRGRQASLSRINRISLNESIKKFEMKSFRTLSPRLLYQLNQKISKMDGWHELQDEIKKKTFYLEPVEFEGFFIIKS